MKFKFDVECTPEEARQFFGLPDVKPMQDAMMRRIEQQMLDGLAQMTPEALFRTWMPGWSPNQVQELMASMMRASFGGGSAKPGGG